MKGNTLTRFTKGLLDFMFFAGIAVTVTLPVSVKIYGYFNSYFEQFYIHLVILFAISGVLAELILYELRNMFRTVLANDCFVEANVKSLNRMGTYSFLIALVTYDTTGCKVCRIVLVVGNALCDILGCLFFDILVVCL